MTNFHLTVLAFVLSTLLPRLARAYDVVQAGNGICTTSTPITLRGVGGRTTQTQPRWRCADGVPAIVTGGSVPVPATTQVGSGGGTLATVQACVDGYQRVTLGGTTTVRVPCRNSPATAPTVRPPTGLPTVATAPTVRPAPIPTGMRTTWDRVWLNGGSRFPPPVAPAPPVEEPPPPPAPLAALPRNDVFELRVQFVAFSRILENEQTTPQGIVCVARAANETVIDNMNETQRRERCREWGPELNPRNDYAQPFLLAREGTWFVSRYARAVIGERGWHTQRMEAIDATRRIIQLFPDDVRGGSDDPPIVVPSDTHRLPPSTVAARTHRRGGHHGHAQRVRRSSYRCCRVACR